VRPNLKSVPVVDSDGKRLFEVTRDQAIGGIKARLAFVVEGGKAIRLKAKPGSRSSPALSSVDTVALALSRDTKMSSRRRERLAGWDDFREMSLAAAT
jgi:hypothetical protein